MSERYMIDGGTVLHLHDVTMTKADNRSTTLCGRQAAFTDKEPGQKVHPKLDKKLRLCKMCERIRDARDEQDAVHDYYEAQKDNMRLGTEY